MRDEITSRLETSMKRAMTIFLLLVLFAAFSQGQTREQEVMALENRRVEALVRGDTDFLENLFGDNYILTTFDGQVRDKFFTLGAMGGGETSFDFLNYEDMDIRITGDTAIVTGTAIRNGRSRGRIISGDFRFTHVWVSLQGQWKLVAIQESRIAG